MNLTSINSPERGHGTRPVVTDARAFDDSRDQRFYFASQTHEQALGSLLDRLEHNSHAFALVDGEAGSGKTYLRTALAHSLDASRYARVSIESSLLDFDQLLLEILSQLTGRRVLTGEFADRYARIAEFKRVLSQRVVPAGRRLALLVDEAQGLDLRVLEQLRQLANISSERHGIVSPVLFCSSNASTRLAAAPELDWRFGRVLSLGNFSADETRQYVMHRLEVAGSTAKPAFSDTAWERLHGATGGLPGHLNRAMREVISLAARSGSDLEDDRLAQALSQLPAVSAGDAFLS